MFQLSSAAANPEVAKKWLMVAGVTTAASGAVTLATVLDSVKKIFPAQVLEQLPNYQQFFYLALAIAFVTALPLLLARKVICVSFAQLGFASSLLYLSCGLFGVFANGYEKILFALLCIMILVFILLFSGGIRYAAQQKSWSDVWLGIVLLVIFVGVWFYPIRQIWGRR